MSRRHFTTSLAVKACVVTAAAMGHPVLFFGRESWMRLNTRVFDTLFKRGPGGMRQMVSELPLSNRVAAGAYFYAIHAFAGVWPVVSSSIHRSYGYADAGKGPVSGWGQSCPLFGFSRSCRRLCIWSLCFLAWGKYPRRMFSFFERI